MSFLLAVFRHAGPIRVDLNIAPGVFDILLSPDIALVNGFLTRCSHARRGVGGLHEQRGGNQRTESESGKKRPHVTFPSCITGCQSAIPQPNFVPVAPQSSTIPPQLSGGLVRFRYVYLGGEYGSGVPSLIGGYFFRLSKNSPTIFVAAAPTHELCQTAPSRSSFRSVRRLMTFGSGRVTGGSYMFSCQIKCTFQFRHLTADNRSAT